MSPKQHLIVFTRYPEPGVTKTRLIPKLGERGAAALQRRMTQHVLDHVREFASQMDGALSVEVRFDGGDARRMAAAFGDECRYIQQGDGDLGERMWRAFRDAERDGKARTVIIGSDCPAITPHVLRDAFDQLERDDLVLGPASDGGYYLIGLRQPEQELFKGIAWGTSSVYEQTLAIARAKELSTQILEELADVDRPEDLREWDRLVANSAAMISIIVPTHNEAKRIQEVVGRARQGENLEVIVVDADSADRTAELAESMGARVIQAKKNRAAQLNAGASVAEGGILLFLHADTFLPERFASYVRQTLSRDGVIAGAFKFRVSGNHPGLRLIECTANFRSKVMSMPYGDQGIFLRAETFSDLGGFPDMPIMEDFELMRRLKRRGKIAIVPAPAVTSARRWREKGFFRTTLINQAIILGYYAGLSPERLAKWYDR